MTRMAIEARDLQLAYQRKTILNHLNLAVPEGAVLGLVGRNGAGKSTLMRCLTGLLKPTQGDCRIGGYPSQDLADEVRERLGVVAQTPDLFEWLTGEQHFEQIGTMYRDWQHDRAWGLAAQLDLPLLTPARALSLGDQQKLAVVLAFGHDPDWLLLDEPVAGMTDEETERTAELFLSLKGKHSLLVVEHDMGFINTISDIVTVLCDGAVLAQGTLAQVQADERVIEVYLGR